MTNLVAGIEKWVGNPSYRPRFNVHWSVSMLGALGCYGAMFLINPWRPWSPLSSAMASSFIWSDGRCPVPGATYAAASGLRWPAMRCSIWRTKLGTRKTGAPTFSSSRASLTIAEQLVQLADWLSSGKGIVTFMQLLIGDVDQLAGRNTGDCTQAHPQLYSGQTHDGLCRS